MTCAELKELAAAYALDALEPEERAAVEAHLAEATHEGCREAVAVARSSVDALGAALPPVAPAPGTWAAIEKQLGASPAAAGASVPARRPGAGRPRRFVARALPWVLVAAAATALFWMNDQLKVERAAREKTLQIARGIEGDRDQNRSRLETAVADRTRCLSELDGVKQELELRTRAVAMLQQPATRVVAFSAKAETGGGGATAIVNLAEKRAMILAHGMPKPEGKDYELWVIKGEVKTAAGLMRAGETGELLVEIDARLLAGGADALAVTLEPEGGGVQPVGPLVLVAAMPPT